MREYPTSGKREVSLLLKIFSALDKELFSPEIDFSQEYVVLQDADAMLNGQPQYTHAQYLNIRFEATERRVLNRCRIPIG